jgi:acyl-CoA thioesterase FadM
MTLYFRFLIRVIGYLFCKKDHNPHMPMEVFFRVQLTDLDLNLHLTNSRYPAFVDLARLDFFIKSGIWERGRSQGWMPVLSTSYMRFRRDLGLYDKFTVRVELLYMSPRWVYLDYKFIKDGFVYCHVVQKGGFYERGVGMVSPHKLAPPLPGQEDFKNPPSHIAKLMDAEDEFRLVVRKHKE